MANTIGSVSDQLITFGNELLVQLKANLPLTNTVSTNFSDSMGAVQMNGLTARVPYVIVPQSAAEVAVDGSFSATAVSSGYVDVPYVRIAQAVSVDNLQETVSNVDLMSEFARQLAYNIGEKCESKILALSNYMPYETTPTTSSQLFNATDDLKNVAAITKILSDNKAPIADRARLHGVIPTHEAQRFRSLASATAAYAAGSANLRETGALPSVLGYNLHESQLMPSLTASTAAEWSTNPLIDNNPAGYPAGATTIHVDALGTGTIKKGSTFSLNGVRYTVTADATIGSNEADLSIFPSLRAAAADGDELLETAHAAAASMSYFYHSSAIVAFSRPSKPFSGNIPSVVVRDPVSGLSIRLNLETTIVGNPGFQDIISADILFGTMVVRPEWVVKVFGATS